MKHTRIVLLIVALVIAAGAIVATMPTKQGLDIAGGIRVVLEAETDKLPRGEQWTEKHLESVIRIIRSRVDIQGVSEPLIQPKGTNQIVVELPDIDDKQAAIDQIKSTAQLEFRHFHHVHFHSATQYRPAAAKYSMESGVDEDGRSTFFFFDREGNEVDKSVVIEESTLILTGDDIRPVSNAEKNPSTFQTVVALEFSPEGRRKFADFTRRNVDEILAIVLDGQILSAPSIRQPILDGRAIIEGNFETREAQELAQMINAGALPVPLEIVQIQSVEATLGRDSVERSIQAGIWGLLAIVVFMVGYYLLPGLLAAVALLIYALLAFAAFKLIPVTLTLPGIAAFILSIGMAVDANILIFERLKEELRTGKTLRASIDAGFSRAFTAIFDANMCTLITCAILWYYGSGPVQGFATVLGIGVIISFFTALTVTRTMLRLVANTGLSQNLAFFGTRRHWVGGHTEGRRIDLVRHASKYFALSGILIVASMALLVSMGGLKLGIDFTGGSMMQLTFEEPVDRVSVVQVLDSEGLTGSMVQRSGDDERVVFIRTKQISEGEMNTVLASLETSVGSFEPSSIESIGGTISRELTLDAIKAIIIAIIAIILYLSIRFAIGGLAYGFRFGLCTVAALVHDVAIVVGAFAVFGYFLNWEINSLFVTAMLTIIGYSVNDTIVIFDRVRENMRHKARGESFDDLVNKSIHQSFSRSINTTLTLVFALVALMAFGAPVFRQFIVALLIGTIVGTYSSIFNASQLLALWERVTQKKPGYTPGQPAVSGADKAKDHKPIESVSDSSNGDSDVDGLADHTSKDHIGEGKSKSKKQKRRF